MLSDDRWCKFPDQDGPLMGLAGCWTKENGTISLTTQNKDSMFNEVKHIPSGHSRTKAIPYYNVQPVDPVPVDYKINFSSMSKSQDFSGPYKNWEPPGDRTPAVGEKIWGDVPYLPSYLDPMYQKQLPSEPIDNLYFRGPFFKGVSETHSEFVNHGVLPKKQYHAYVRHYEEPGMRNCKSVTQEDFTPPLPMLPKDKSPCLKEEFAKTFCEPERKLPKNPHAKEVEVRYRDPVTVYVDDGEVKRDFVTEHSANYICYQKSKTGSKVKDPQSTPGEIFLKNLRENHQKCFHSNTPSDFFLQNLERCPEATTRGKSWLLHPEKYTFKNLCKW